MGVEKVCRYCPPRPAPAAVQRAREVVSAQGGASSVSKSLHGLVSRRVAGAGKEKLCGDAKTVSGFRCQFRFGKSSTITTVTFVAPSYQDRYWIRREVGQRFLGG